MNLRGTWEADKMLLNKNSINLAHQILFFFYNKHVKCKIKCAFVVDIVGDWSTCSGN